MYIEREGFYINIIKDKMPIEIFVFYKNNMILIYLQLSWNLIDG